MKAHLKQSTFPWKNAVIGAAMIVASSAGAGIVAAPSGLIVLSDNAVPVTTISLSPIGFAGDPRAQVEFSLPSILGANNTQDALSSLASAGLSVELFCPDQDGNIAAPIPFSQAVTCEINASGQWVVTHDRLVVITGTLHPDENQGTLLKYHWEMLRLSEDNPDITIFNPGDVWVVKDVGMTEHYGPFLENPGPI